MSSMMEQLTKDITTNVVSQITGKVLPAISDRYDIDLDELVEFVSNRTTKKNVIKAKPKKKTSQKPKKASVTSSKTKASPKKSGVTALQEKIAAAQAADKVFNVTTGKPIMVNAKNRKSYQIISELGIAGKSGEEKFMAALKALGAPKKKETPVHKQAEKARARAKKKVVQQPVEPVTESESETEIPAPKNYKSKDVEPDQESEVSEPDEEESEAPPAEDDSDEEDEEELETEEESEAPPAEEDSDEDEESEAPPAEEDSDEDEESNAPPAEDDNNDEEESEAPPADDDSDEEEDEKVEDVVKMSDLVDQSDSESDSESETEAEPVKSTPTKRLRPVYNSKVKNWWNPDTKFVLKRRGIKSIVIGKVINNNDIAQLTSADIKQCKKNGWMYDTNILKKSTKEDSDSDSD